MASNIKKVVVIYPGRFEPFGKHHAATFLWVKKNFPKADCYIATSDVTGDKSPFNFDEKKAIIGVYGLGNNVKEVTSPYKATEILSKYDPKTTAVVFVLGKKDSDRLQHSKYFISYKVGDEITKPYPENGYALEAPHISLKVPGFGEMSGTTIRQALGDTTKTRKQKQKLFKDIFGWYSEKMANIIFNKLEKLHEDVIPGGLADNKSLEDIAKHHDVKIEDLKRELIRGIKVELEHTSDPKIAKEIATDHLWEDPKYYTKLDAIETDESAIKEQKYKIFSPDWWKELIIQESLADHSREELKRAGLFDKDSDYSGMIGSAVQELINTFAEQGHSGFSAAWVTDLFTKLAKYEALTPLTSESDEWYDCSEASGEPMWQNKRNPAVFSKDGGKTMYHVDGKTIKNGIVEGVRRYLAQNKTLILEGGAAGHMAHPFDLPQVKKGLDLVKVFVDSAKSLQNNPGAVKIDGINTSIKIINKNGKLQFALDRGSTKDIDKQGITTDKLDQRFPEGHGMLRIGKIVLEEFNKCIPTIKGELEKLGMTKDPNLLLNVEAVINNESGKTNVISYKENFFVIHGLIKLEQTSEKSKRVAKEVSGTKNIIEDLVKKAKPIMKKDGYGLYGTIPTTVNGSISFNSALNTPVTVLYNKKDKVTKPLKDWLKTVVNPRDSKVKFSDGRTDTAMTKKNYFAVVNQLVPLDDLASDPKSQKAIVDGAMLYHATRLLGNEVLDKLDSEVGNAKEHEGIVVRDPKISKVPFKLVGEFLVSGTNSEFGKK